MDLTLSAALTDNSRTRPLLTGAIRPQSITLYASALYPTEIFWRQLHYSEFDVSEMSLSSLFIATSKGNTDWVGIPVFTTRRFFHTGIMVRTDRGIQSPADLAGKRVGVPEYQQTAALWTRGVLRDEFGVQPSSMQWFMERNPDQSHGGATGFTPPADVRLSYVPREKSIGGMLVAGELDALIHFTPGQNIIDRTTVNPLTSPDVRRLFPAGDVEAHRYFTKTGIYPINHCVVVRRSIVREHPWVVLNIFNAFVEAKEHARKQLDALVEPFLSTGALDHDAGRALRTDVLPYGVNASRAVLETVSRFVHEDGLTSRRVGVEEIFAEQTMQL